MAKKALLVGIGRAYPDPYKVNGPINDISNWTYTLQNRGFSILQLVEYSATRNNILNALYVFIRSLQPGDSGIIVLGGHGSYVTDINRDEPDNRDECFVSVDVLPITDDTLRAITSTKKSGVTLDIVLNCCYAGTGTRATKNNTYETYSIPGPLKSDKAKLGAVVPVSSMNHRLWAACADNQTSWGVIYNGTIQTLFAIYLCWAIRKYPDKSATELMNIVAPYVQAVNPDQVPQLEGINLSNVPF